MDEDKLSLLLPSFHLWQLTLLRGQQEAATSLPCTALPPALLCAPEEKWEGDGMDPQKTAVACLNTGVEKSTELIYRRSCIHIIKILFESFQEKNKKQNNQKCSNSAVIRLMHISTSYPSASYWGHRCIVCQKLPGAGLKSENYSVFLWVFFFFFPIC